MSNKKRTPKKPHRYFLMPTSYDEDNGNKTCSRIVVFKNGSDKGGTSYFEDSKPGINWWTLDEMKTLKCVEIPAALVKEIAKV